jgi:membrane dipeptidase
VFALSRRFVSILCLCASLILVLAVAETRGDELAERAKKLHFSTIVLDTHDDTTQRLMGGKFDVAKRDNEGSIDIPRMREGGLNAIFFSIWIDGQIMGPPAVQKALDQIDAVHEMVRKNSKDLVFCTTAGEIRQAHKEGKIAVLMGVEGGHMIGNDIRMVRIFGDLGARYMTLSHFYYVDWADSATDNPAHIGLDS